MRRHCDLFRLLLAVLALVALVAVAAAAGSSTATGASTTGSSSSSNPNNIHAVIVSSSRYWFNYRHFVNALSIYHVLKENGVPDTNIVLMLADEIPSNARNPYKNGMFPKGVTQHTLYNASTEIDYRGADVTVENLFHVLLGTSHEAPGTTTTSGSSSSSSSSSMAGRRSSSRVLHPNLNSNVLIYMTGHGGDQFFKFQDEEEITADDFANLMTAMYHRKRYGKLLFLTDTCQAFTLADKTTSPNVYTVASSLREESAYAHHSDPDLGLAVIERYTHSMIEYYYNFTTVASSVHDVLVEPFLNGAAPRLTNKALGANIGVKEDLGDQKLSEILMSDFFGPKKPSTRAELRLLQETQKRERARSAAMQAAAWNERRMLMRSEQSDWIIPPPQTMHNVENKDMDESLESTRRTATAAPTACPSQEDAATWEPSSPEFLGLVASLGVLIVTLALWDRRETLLPEDDDS
jgi:GPI-anchor transamidase subunit K